MPTKITDIPIDWAHWFTGVCDGEATFNARPDWRRHSGVTPRFAICMQQDESLLEEIRRHLGIGSISPRPERDGRHAGHTWSVDSARDLAYICDFFDAFPLRSKKQAEFQHWRVLVANLQHRTLTFSEALSHALALSELNDRRKGQAQGFRARAAEFLSNSTATPNHALQRTAPRVTVAAISSSNPSPPSHLFP